MRQILADGNVLSNYGITEEVKFDVVAKANKLLHSKGFKQLPMHDNAPLHKADFDELVMQARKQVEKGENVFRPLFTMLTGQTIQDSASKAAIDDAVSPKGSEVSAFFAPHPNGNAYTYASPFPLCLFVTLWQVQVGRAHQPEDPRGSQAQHRAQAEAEPRQSARRFRRHLLR